MKCFECDDSIVRDIGYVIMRTLFPMDGGKLETEFGHHAVVGYDSMSSAVTSGHLLFMSPDFRECVKRYAECVYQLEHYPDDDMGFGCSGDSHPVNPEPDCSRCPFRR